MEDNMYLYRAKRLDNGEWVQGYLVYDNRDKLYRIIMEIQYSTGTCITTDNAPRVDSSTICQCTGLKDKNGKLIWENDIVKGKYYDGGKAYEHIGQIKYYCQSYKVVGINQYKGYHAELDGLYETVGNIFDNPQLLESE